MIKFIKAEVDAFNGNINNCCVFVTYHIDDVEFTVDWSRVDNHGNLDEEGVFDIYDFYCDDESIKSRLLAAIEMCEDDNNAELDLYLAIRDTFTAEECAEIADDAIAESRQ